MNICNSIWLLFQLDGILFGFLLLSSSSVFQSAAVPGRRNSISQPAQSPVRCVLFFMSVSKIHIISFSIFLLVACSTKSDKINKSIAFDRQCDCSQLLDRQERGFYLKFLEGDDTLYTGKCKLTNENGNEISYTYLRGHIIEQIERYPGGALNDEMYYDTTGLITKRVQYYQNGHISYLRFNGDHSYESFYEDGRVSRKGMFRLSNKGYNRNEKEFFENLLFDSIWKKNGEFDSVYRYSQASITF